MKVKIHWNLQVGGWSVTPRAKGGKIIPELRQAELVLLNPVAKLAPGKYNDCHSKNKRHVCAWIIGDLVDASEYNTMTDQGLTFNPFKNKHFIDESTGEEIPFNESLGTIATFHQANGKPVLRIGK